MFVSFSNLANTDEKSTQVGKYSFSICDREIGYCNDKEFVHGRFVNLFTHKRIRDGFDFLVVAEYRKKGGGGMLKPAW